MQIKFIITGYSFLVILFSSYVYTLFAGDLQFFKENIDIKIIAPDTVELRGVYYFKNNTNKEITTTLFYPFPIDSTLPYPSRIAVKNHEKLPFETLQNGISFPICLKASGTDSIKVTYKQQALCRRFVYILTTTQFWEESLQNCSVNVLLPYKYELSFLSYETDSVENLEKHLKYSFFRKNIMPDRDLVLEWK